VHLAVLAQAGEVAAPIEAGARRERIGDEALGVFDSPGAAVRAAIDAAAGAAASP